MKQHNHLPTFSHVSFLDKMLFTKHLGIMVKAGIPLPEAVRSLALQAKSPYFKQVLQGIIKHIDNGESLAGSLRKYPKVFDHFFVSLIEVSEESGTLDKNLDFLALQLSKEYQLQKKVKSALLYPIIVFVAISLVGISMSLFVLPKLVELFTSLNTELPLSTKILIGFSTLMRDHGYLVIGALVGLFILIRFLLSLPAIKPTWHRILLTVPIYGHFIQSEQLATLCRNLGVMLQSGLPIRHALEVQTEIMSNLVFKDYVLRIQQAVTKGSSIEHELTKGGFDKMSPIAVKMIDVGEKTGKLDEVLLYLGDFFEEEVDDIARNLSTVLEPIILLVIGAIVAFVALAIISPIYSISSSIRQ